jgi:signal transduction histidine kinase
VQFLQVLLNLVMNACDAMSAASGGREITIRTGLTGEASILVSVIDTGTGIAPDMLERVFEPFYTTKRDGLGLGLTVCRSLVEAHGGRLWATNNPEGGATFHLAHPCAGQGARTEVSGIRDAGSTNPPGGTARS